MRIRIDHIAKIEGHASFVADIVKGDVRAAKIKIDEGARLFEGIMRGRKYHEVPEIGSRICGICPVVHNLTGFKALEAAFGVKPDNQAVLLRKLMMMGQLINSHALHLFFFSLADFFGFKNDIELINQYPEKTHDALKIRDVGNRIIEIIGGRAIHPLTPCVGGLRKFPTKEDLETLAEKCKEALLLAMKFTELFIGLKYPDFERKTRFVSSFSPDEYAVYDGKIKINDESSLREPAEFMLQIKEIQEMDKVAKRSRYRQESYMVGALARINNNSEKLNPEAKKLLEKSNLKLPCFNPFYNILAQAIEIVHCFEESIKVLSKLTSGFDANKNPTEFEIKIGHGVGAIEAPRGTLFYSVDIDKSGIVKNINIITPTAQNLANLEDDLEDFERLGGFKGLTPEQRREKIKMLIRAYDPCITCATH